MPVTNDWNHLHISGQPEVMGFSGCAVGGKGHSLRSHARISMIQAAVMFLMTLRMLLYLEAALHTSSPD